jgi:hypothetical protein
MNRFLDVKHLTLLILLAHVLFGCLSARQPDTALFLRQDYFKMSDAELISYEQELSDALVRSSRSANSGDVSVGVGFGSWSGGSGYGVQADKWLGGGGSNSNTLELENQRNRVRDEMRRRRLLPQ